MFTVGGVVSGFFALPVSERLLCHKHYKHVDTTQVRRSYVPDHLSTNLRATTINIRVPRIYESFPILYMMTELFRFFGHWSRGAKGIRDECVQGGRS